MSKPVSVSKYNRYLILVIRVEGYDFNRLEDRAWRLSESVGNNKLIRFTFFNIKVFLLVKIINSQLTPVAEIKKKYLCDLQYLLKL